MTQHSSISTTASSTDASLKPSEVIGYYVLCVVASLLLYSVGNPRLDLSWFDTLQLVAVMAIATIGAYQLYFWIQAYTQRHRTAIILESRWDQYIPFVPETIIIYAPLFYFSFTLSITNIASYQQFINQAFAVIVLMSLQTLCFYCVPTTIPDSYRSILAGSHAGNQYGYQPRNNIFSKFTVGLLQHLQSIDGMHNACPSAHCSFAVLLAYSLYDRFPIYTSLFPLAVAISCLTTKQHVVADVLPGLTLGYVIAVTLL